MKHTLTERLLRRELKEGSLRHRKIRNLYGDRNWVKDLDIVNELEGHSGCVNALSWSKSGQLLASGSDDQHLNIHTYQPEHSTSQFAFTTTIATGHTANIFSVKFMPHSNDRTLVSAAGDHEVRIFDIEYAGSSTETSVASSLASQGRRRARTSTYNGVRYLNDGDTNCRVYRSHGDRVKRVVTESSPHLFLTCSEDGEVRQWDLRQPSSAYPSPRAGRDHIPPPLISYKRYNLDLNSISCSPSQPHYIALGGAHLHCFLHDRRMLGRDKLSERGGNSPSSANMSDADEELMCQATQCVRKFAPNGQQKMKRTDNGHITACKISDANPDELIASWSGDYIYSFDLVRSPDAAEQTITTPSVSGSSGLRAKESSERKRKRKTGSQTSLNPEATVRAGSRQRIAELAGDNDDVALRVRYQNGQTEDIPIESTPTPNTVLELRETVMNDCQRNAHRVAKAVIKLRKSMFTLGSKKTPTERDPAGHASSFTSVRGYAASILPDMVETHRTWRYPVDPLPEEVAFQRILRANRESAYRFVQASGVIARALGGRLHTASAEDPRDRSLFSQIIFAPNEGSDFSPSERFGYDFLKAILLWVDSGLGAVIEGFSSSSSAVRPGSRLPIPKDSTIEAIDEILIPYLLRLASDQSIINVDTSRYEVDENRVLYSTEKSAVLAFAAALKVPFADLSSAVAPSSSSADRDQSLEVPTQNRRDALLHWVFAVGRGVLMNAGEGVNFALVDRAFGGLGTSDSETADEESSMRQRQEDIDPSIEEQSIRELEIVSNRTAGTWNGTSEAMDAEEDVIAISELTAMIEDDDTTVPSISIRAAEIEPNEHEDDDDDDENEDADAPSDDDEHHSDSEAEESNISQYLYRSAFSRRRKREHVEENIPCTSHMRSYRGHCNVKTVKDVNFFGLQDEYVVSGSDDGHLFIWDRKSAQLVNILEGDGEVVNVVQGHPYEPMLAVSGIDNTVKIFSPDSRAREAARLGHGVEAADPSSFSSLSWPARMRGRRLPRQSTSSSEPAVPRSEAQMVEDDDEYVAPNGLASRKRMHLEYQIVAQNDVERQGGNQEAFITRSMLATLAQHIRRRRTEGGEELADEEGGELGGFGGGRIVVGDDCVVQ